MTADNPRPLFIAVLGILIAGSTALAIWSATEAKVVPSASAESVMTAAGLESYPTIAYMKDSDVCRGLGMATIGCFSTATPNIIYVASDLPASLEKSVILHELAHYHQHQIGLPLDECHADELAVLWGADARHSGYKEECDS